MKKIAKKTISILIFIGILSCSISAVSKVLCYDDELDSNQVFSDYYAQEKDTVDGIYLGNSISQRGWVSPLAYKEQGLTIYSLATANQPLVLTKGIMAEALKTQKVKLFIIELRGTFKPPKRISEDGIRRVTDTMHSSLNRLSMVDYALDYASKSDANDVNRDISYYLPILRYHSRWNHMAEDNSMGVEYLQGFAYYEPTEFLVKPIKDYEVTYEKSPMNADTEQVLLDLLDFCDEHPEAEFLFVAAPAKTRVQEQRILNYAQEIIEARGYNVLNFMHEDIRNALGVDYRTFFYNISHLNYYGATKYTSFLSKYIRDNYDLPDRRAEAPVKWENAYDDLTEIVGDKLQELENHIQGGHD